MWWRSSKTDVNPESGDELVWQPWPWLFFHFNDNSKCKFHCLKRTYILKSRDTLDHSFRCFCQNLLPQSRIHPRLLEPCLDIDSRLPMLKWHDSHLRTLSGHWSWLYSRRTCTNKQHEKPLVNHDYDKSIRNWSLDPQFERAEKSVMKEGKWNHLLITVLALDSFLDCEDSKHFSNNTLGFLVLGSSKLVSDTSDDSSHVLLVRFSPSSW